MDLRRHLGDGPAPAARTPARPGQAKPVSLLRQSAPAEARKASLGAAEAARSNIGARASRPPSGNVTATWIAPGRYRLDLRYQLLDAATNAVLAWPPITMRLDWSGQHRRLVGSGELRASLEVTVNEPVQVRLNEITLGGLLELLSGNSWGEVLRVDQTGKVVAEPVDGLQQPVR